LIKKEYRRSHQWGRKVKVKQASKKGRRGLVAGKRSQPRIGKRQDQHDDGHWHSKTVFSATPKKRNPAMDSHQEKKMG